MALNMTISERILHCLRGVLQWWLQVGVGGVLQVEPLPDMYETLGLVPSRGKGKGEGDISIPGHAQGVNNQIEPKDRLGVFFLQEAQEGRSSCTGVEGKDQFLD